MNSNRIESYLVLAATPALISTIATAEVHRYDGPAISVTTNGLPDPYNFDRFKSTSFNVGGGSIHARVYLSVGAWRHSSISFYNYGRSAGVRGHGPENLYGGFFVGQGQELEDKPNAQRFSYSQRMSKTNLANHEAQIGGSSHGDQSGFGEFNGGVEEGEQRGYVGFYLETLDPTGAPLGFGIGWLDIGYDFDTNTLTMYDWAFNDDGDLYAGHDTPPASVPGPTGLLALAAGAAGIRRKRNRVA